MNQIMKRTTSVFLPALILAGLMPAGAVLASDLPQFVLPLDCRLNEDCWVARYMDVDPAKGSAKDFTCGTRTQDEHKGTDFAIRSFADLERGVNVLAARDGKVLRIRDGQPDGPKTDDEFKAIESDKHECGNGIVIDHGSGMVTFYCHLKEGSLKVKPDELVKTGQPIAEVGQSGLSEYPHLHFSLIWEGGYIDPFTDQTMEDGCGKFTDNLWKPDIAYDPVALYDAGFSGKLPDFEQIATGQNRPDSLPAAGTGAGDDALVFWIAYFGAAEGDMVDMTITAPDGSLFAEKHSPQDKTRMRQYYYIGKRNDGTLQPGTYIGQATIKREGYPDQSITRQIQFTP